MEPIVEVRALPCPFCGGEPETAFHGLEQTYSVGCDGCGANMAYVGLSGAEAIRAWNVRTPSSDLKADNAALVEALREIAEITARGTLPITHQINEIARAALQATEPRP